MEIEGFGTILSSLTLAKNLHDIDRFDIVEQQFSDELCWDDYYQNLLGVMSSIFTGFDNSCDDYESEVMVFTDDIISDYFVHAWEHGKLYNLSFDQNPYISQAREVVQRWLDFSYCVDWKLLAYAKTKRAARRSKLIVSLYQCGCNADFGVAFGLIKLYAWFRDKCAEFKALEDIPDKVKESTFIKQTKSNTWEAMAA